MDPNWFYSTIAQASANIVGVFGAILATWLHSRIERASVQQLRSTEALNRLTQFALPLLAQLEVYVQHSEAQIALIRSEIPAGTPAPLYEIETSPETLAYFEGPYL